MAQRCGSSNPSTIGSRKNILLNISVKDFYYHCQLFYRVAYYENGPSVVIIKKRLFIIRLCNPNRGEELHIVLTNGH